MKQPIIGICGYIGSGKTTAANALIEIGYTRVRFAETLKNMLKCLGLTDAQVDGADKEKVHSYFGKTPRYMMQTLGTEWGRNLINKDIWILDWAYRVGNTGGAIVIDDMRFPNEVQAIRDLGGFILRIDRAHKSDDHPSEDLSHITADHTIFNTVSIEVFQEYVRNIGRNVMSMHAA